MTLVWLAVSGILVRMATGKSFLMDCGEGTYGQMVRQFGSHAGGVSHVRVAVHDYCLSRLKVLSWRRSSSPFVECGFLTCTPITTWACCASLWSVIWYVLVDLCRVAITSNDRLAAPCSQRDGPLLVVGPWPLKMWLAEVGTLEPALRSKYTFVDARDLLCSASCTEGENEPTTGHKRTRERAEDDSSARRASAVETVRRMMRVRNFRTVQVKHCYMVGTLLCWSCLAFPFVVRDIWCLLCQSFGVRVDLPTGTSVVYSGDCRPSDALVALGQVGGWVSVCPGGGGGCLSLCLCL